jgi:glycosyltransferase involved in cell wall biosynthesis
MKVSIAIATYNRAGEVARTLDSLARVDARLAEEYELILVANNCTDDTAAVAAARAPEFGGRFRYVEENRQGLSHARNRAIAESRFEIVAFLDDDVEVDGAWLNALVTAFKIEGCAAVGGRAYLIYPEGRPAWLNDTSEGLLTKVECGPERRPADAEELYGVNLSFRREWLDRVGPFRAELGRVGTSLIGDEDVDMLRRVAEAGGRLVYEPAAVVGHRVAPARLRKSWFWSRSYWGNLGATRVIPVDGVTLRSLRRPTYQVARTTCLLFRESWRHGPRSSQTFFQTTRLAGHLGTWAGTAERLLDRWRPGSRALPRGVGAAY